MRIVAALSIFFYHASDFVPFGSQRGFLEYIGITWQAGYTGLTFFFILSGFVLTWATRRGDTAPRFWRRRLVRIYPNYLLTFVAAFAILTWLSPASGTKNGYLANLFMIQAWFPQVSVRTSVDAVSWSLSAELLFYLLFPVLQRLIGRIRPQHLWTWAGVIIGLVIFIPVLPTPHQQPMAHIGLTPYQLWILFHFPPMRMLDFVLGIILARIVMTGRKVPLSLGGAVAFLVAAYALSGFFPPKFQIDSTIILPAALVVTAGAVADIRGTRTFVGSPLMARLGDLAFAFYLWHRLVLICVYQWFGQGKPWTTPGALTVLVVEAAVALGLSWLTFTYFEQPLMRRFGESSRARPRPTLTVAPEPVVVPAAAGPAPQLAEPAMSPSAANGRADHPFTP